MTLVSVVVPTRDRQRLLEETLRAILRQTHTDLEVLVSDDGSVTCNFSAIAALDDPRVRLLGSPVSSGVAAARNRALAVASGEIVAFCDDDDLWLPDKIERQLRAMRESGRDWSYCSALIVSERLAPRSRRDGPVTWITDEIFLRNLVPGGGSSVALTRDLSRRVGPFDTGFSQFADWDMWTRLALVGPPADTGEIGLLYRDHAAQMSVDFTVMAAELSRYRLKYADRVTRIAGLAPMDAYIAHRIRRASRWGWMRGIAYVYRSARPPVHRSALKTMLLLLAHGFGLPDQGPGSPELEKYVRRVVDTDRR